MKLVLMLLLGGSSSLFADTHWGVAKNKQGKIVYTEKHDVQYHASKVMTSITTYYLADRNTEIAILKSDYQKSLKLPIYEFQDLRTGYREGVSNENGQYKAYFKDPGQKLRSELIEPNDNLFAGQGWHYYLRDRLNLLEEEDLQLDLVLPGKLTYYSFRIHPVESTGSRLTVYFEMNNWFLRMLAPKLTLIYDKITRKLIEYEGLSNLKSEEGEEQNVKIHYEYSGGKLVP